MQLDTLFAAQKFQKTKHWETGYIEHFPNHFPQGSCPCHMLGGCRSSLETSIEHDGWHALADTLEHLIFLSEFIFYFREGEDGGALFVHLKQKTNSGFVFCFRKMLQSCENMDEETLRLEGRQCTTVCSQW